MPILVVEILRKNYVAACGSDARPDLANCTRIRLRRRLFSNGTAASWRSGVDTFRPKPDASMLQALDDPTPDRPSCRTRSRRGAMRCS